MEVLHLFAYWTFSIIPSSFCIKKMFSRRIGTSIVTLIALWIPGDTAYTNVEGIPEINPFMFNARMSEGSTVNVLCSVVHGKRPFEFQWQKDGKKIREKSRNVQIASQEDFSMLTVSDIKANDAGNYTCSVKNSVGTSRHTAYLVVEASPIWLTTSPDTTGVYGSVLRLHCAAAGSPPPRITWHKGSDVIDADGSRVVANGNGTLTINILNEEDEGVYRCKAHNGVGDTLEKEIKIIVNGKR